MCAYVYVFVFSITLTYIASRFCLVNYCHSNRSNYYYITVSTCVDLLDNGNSPSLTAVFYQIFINRYFVHLYVGQVVSGGVACNQYIAKGLGILCRELGYTLKIPPRHLCTDNGVMIAWNGVEKWRLGSDIYEHTELDKIDIQGRLVKFYNSENFNININQNTIIIIIRYVFVSGVLLVRI